VGRDEGQLERCKTFQHSLRHLEKATEKIYMALYIQFYFVI